VAILVGVRIRRMRLAQPERRNPETLAMIDQGDDFIRRIDLRQEHLDLAADHDIQLVGGHALVEKRLIPPHQNQPRRRRQPLLGFGFQSAKVFQPADDFADAEWRERGGVHGGVPVA
jgi:hypothetical protein